MDRDLHDIYRAEEVGRETPASANQLSEQIAKSLRRQWLFNLFAGLSVFGLLAALTWALVSSYWPESEKAVKFASKTPYIAAYTLPPDEQWAVEYRQIAFQADSSEPPGPKPLSSKWVKNAAYHMIMGEQALRLNNVDVARDHLEAALKTLPSATGLHRYLGEAYLKEQSFEKAAEHLQMALEEARSPDVLNNLGVAYIGIGEYAKAEELLNEVLRQDPDCAGCYKNMALLYQQAGDTNKTIAAFEKYLSLNPQDTKQLERYISYLTAAGRIRDVIAFLDKVDGADPLTVHLLLARAAAADNDAERAVRALRETARFRTPSQTIAEMHEPVFEKIARTEPFEALIYQLELAAVSLSTNLNRPMEPDIKTNR